MKQLSTRKKTFALNKIKSIYGTFAEIGAGQETVNHFFRAGLASQTIAKSMSAYDMAFSDDIYGKQNRYVCKDRLITMLNHEYNLLQRRLKDQREQKGFFAFANTAATSSLNKNEIKTKPHHSWMGIRFQAQAQTPYNDVTFHVNCLDRTRLQQHEALGILGVNLIYSCFHYRKNSKKFISSLNDNLRNSRIEINELTFHGPSLKHFDETLLNIELLNQKLSSIVFFDPKGKVKLITDSIFKKDLLLIDKERSLEEDFIKNVLSKHKKSTLPILIVSQKDLKKTDTSKQIRSLNKNKFYLLVSKEKNVSRIKELLKSHVQKGQKIVDYLNSDK